MVDREGYSREGAITRRSALGAIGVGVLSAVTGGCGIASSTSPSPQRATDFSARFARFEVANEPDGDLTKVVWPEFVTRAGPEVKRLYEFQIQNGELMKYMPCFCGCGADGHRNNRDCYVKMVNPDGSVVFDAMAPT